MLYDDLSIGPIDLCDSVCGEFCEPFRSSQPPPPGPKMDARIGLEYIIENNDYVNKLGLALDTNNVTVKKQIFELLSTLCAFSANGYKRAIETLEHYKSIKGERYRLHLVVSELDKATAIEYQIALLAFVNCVIISAGSLKDRIRMRNEFIGKCVFCGSRGSEILM
uniref:Formin FH3 domain-containing protein n=1 Tax=Anopheles melas TaxID=34690 RepID=A0A182UDV8_9DIPT